MTSAFLERPLRTLAEVTSARKKSSPREDALSVLRGELDRIDREVKAKLLQRAKVDALIIGVARGVIPPDAVNTPQKALEMVK